MRAAAARAVAADLRRYLAYEARDGLDWEPCGLELRFGFDEQDEPEGSLPALELGRRRARPRDHRPGRRGRRGHAIVRDYKSGGARPEHQGARWAIDRQLQVALYMIAVRELLGLEPVAGFYQPLGGGDLRAARRVPGRRRRRRLVWSATTRRDPEELEELLEDARTRAVALAARLRAGSLEPCPATCSRDGCRYPGICRA